MRLAIISDRILYDYTYDVIERHPEMNAEVIAFPALKIADFPAYRGIPVPPVAQLKEIGCDTVLFAFYSPERILVTLDALDAIPDFEPEIWLLTADAMDARADFVRYGTFDLRYVFPIQKVEDRYRIVMDPYEWATNQPRNGQDLKCLRYQAQEYFRGEYSKTHWATTPPASNDGVKPIRIGLVGPIYAFAWAWDEAPRNFGGNHAGIIDRLHQKSGFSAEIFSAVGEDIYGRMILDAFAEAGIHHHIRMVPGECTARLRVEVNPDGDRSPDSNGLFAGALRNYKLSEDDIAEIKTLDYVMAEYAVPAAWQLAEINRYTHFGLLVDFGERYHAASIEKILPGVDIGIFSAEGSSEEELLPRIKAWSEHWGGVFILTLAEKGSVACKDGVVYRMPAEPIPEVLNTAGCGDTYKTEFLCSYLKNQDIPAAMKAASVAAKERILQNNKWMRETREP